jgi:hypothetical protein
MAPGSAAPGSPLNPERVAYWYFRLNGFLQIENFIVHPERRGGQRTDAELLGVRFRHRAERAFDHGEAMRDDPGLQLSPDFGDIAITEVKTNQPCTLSGPWTKPERQNIHRVLAAPGCMESGAIHAAADSIYRHGSAIAGNTRIRLIAIGRSANPMLAERFPDVLQLTWNEILGFIWDRHRQYRRQKRNAPQWDACGLHLRDMADAMGKGVFGAQSLHLMGVERPEAIA